MASTAYRPAGFSDDDEDSDEDNYDEWGNYKKKATFNHNQPLNICYCLRTKNSDSLLQCLADLKTKNATLDEENNEVPLIVACSLPWLEGVQILLENGANPNAEKELFTPLAMCCDGKLHADVILASCVDLLLQYGSNPNKRDSLGRVPLIIAAERGLIMVIKSLLKHPNTDINATDPNQWTALFHAKAHGHFALVEILIDAGLDPNVKARNLLSFSEVEVPVSQLESVVEDNDVSVDDFFSKQPAPCYDMHDTPTEYIEHFLSNLPDKNGRGGLRDSVPIVLDAVGCPHVSLPQAHLSDLLIGDENLLEKLGASISFNRQQILEAVHRFHIMKWKSNSLVRVPLNQEIGLSCVGDALTKHLQQLIIMNSTIQYLKRRIDGYQPTAVPKHSELRDILISIQKCCLKLESQYHSVISQLNQVKTVKESPAAHIGPYHAVRQRSSSVKIFSSLIIIFSICVTYRLFV